MQMIWSAAQGDVSPPPLLPPRLLNLSISLSRSRPSPQEKCFLLCLLPLSRKSFISLVVRPLAIFQFSAEDEGGEGKGGEGRGVGGGYGRAPLPPPFSQITVISYLQTLAVGGSHFLIL